MTALTSAYPPPSLPSITINTPDIGTSSSTNNMTQHLQRSIDQTNNQTKDTMSNSIPTQTIPTDPSSEEQQSCYLCDAENPGDFAPTTKFVTTCLLCSRPFCPLHKAMPLNSTEIQSPTEPTNIVDPASAVCNINHSKYYHDNPELQDKQVYPSLGEREKMLWTTQQNGGLKRPDALGHGRSLSSVARELNLSEEAKNALIEEKEVIGADIAV